MVDKSKKEERTSPLGTYEKGMPWNEVEKVIFERRSIRAFKKKPLPDSMIRRILEAGRFAPSAANCQPWKFVVIKSPEVIEAMEKDAVKMAKKIMWAVDHTKSRPRRIFLAPFVKLLIRLMPHKLHPVPFGAMQQMAAEKLPVFHGAPVIILILVDKRGVSNPLLDSGIAGQNMVLAAHSMGAGSCWVGFIKLLLYYRKWKKFFEVQYPFSLNDCIVFGYPKGDYDGEVPREVQRVTWITGGSDDQRRVERQGDPDPETDEE